MSSSLRSVLRCGCVLAAGLTIAACSSGGGAPAATGPSTTPAAAARTPAPAPAPASASASPAPSLSGALRVSITGLPAAPSLAYGGAPIQFTVTLSNGTSSTYSNIMPVVYLAPCSCYSGPVPGEPAGTLELQDTGTGQWHSVFYDHMGSGMDYLLSVQQFPGITLAPGAAASYVLRLAFSPFAQQGSFLKPAGSTAIDATVVALPSHAVIGTDPAARIPLAVTTN